MLHFQHLNFQISRQIMTEWEIWGWCQFYHRIVNSKSFWNVPLDILCPLQTIKWHWTPITDNSCCKQTLYLPPSSQCKKLLDFQKKSILRNLSLHLCAYLWLKIQIAYSHKSLLSPGASEYLLKYDSLPFFTGFSRQHVVLKIEYFDARPRIFRSTLVLCLKIGHINLTW